MKIYWLCLTLSEIITANKFLILELHIVLREGVMEIKEGIYKNQKSYILESSKLKAELICHGGKIVSLKDKKSGREFFWQNTKESEYKIVPNGSYYGDGEFSGFDEMFPTILECFYQGYPWNGVYLPDHGEIWSLDWDCQISKRFIEMRVDGVRLPYSFSKKISFEKEHILKIEYSVYNKSPFPIDFIWAAHPLINIEKGAEIYVPRSAKQVIVTYCPDERIGQYGESHEWPNFLMKDGNEYKANIMRENLGLHSEKYYFKNKLDEGWCALRYTDNTVIALSFPVKQVPYLGIWVNEGGAHGQYNFAPEPCTGILDRIDIAKMNNKISTVEAKNNYKWHLNISVDIKKSIKFVDENGNLK